MNLLIIPPAPKQSIQKIVMTIISVFESQNRKEWKLKGKLRQNQSDFRISQDDIRDWAEIQKREAFLSCHLDISGWIKPRHYRLLLHFLVGLFKFEFKTLILINNSWTLKRIPKDQRPKPNVRIFFTQKNFTPLYQRKICLELTLMSSTWVICLLSALFMGVAILPITSTSAMLECSSSKLRPTAFPGKPIWTKSMRASSRSRESLISIRGMMILMRAKMGSMKLQTLNHRDLKFVRKISLKSKK